MYICNGRFKGRKLLTPPSQRLAEAKVREVLYNKLSEKIQGARVLDLFGGCGALGIEAISWGASFCVFGDKCKKSYEIIKKNIENSQINEETALYLKDAFKLLNDLKNKNEHFDVIFLDPPYNKGLLTKSLHAIKTYDIVCHTSVIVVLGAKTEDIDLNGYKTIFDRTYGYPRVLILQKVSL